MSLSLLLLLALAQSTPDATMERRTWVVHAYANWSPDDQSLVYQSNAAGNWDLYVMRADGGNVHRIVGDPAADITPAFSPDGKKIAFVSERDGNREVYLCAADGSSPVNLTRNAAQDIHPSWSLDGKRLLFSSNRGNTDPEDYDIYAMNADGSGLARITHGPEVDTYASWSPDGKRIVTRRVIQGNNEVFVMNADGSEPRNLTNDPAAYDGWPVWSPDGKHIAFSSGPDGGSPHPIFTMDTDGKDRRALTRAPTETGWVYDTQPAYSHDGRKLVFTRYRPGREESSELIVLQLAAG
jgi:TolB protein